MTGDNADRPEFYRVQFSPEALEQLDGIEDYISGQGSPVNATAHVDGIVDACAGLGTMPHRGTRRDDIRPGLRTTAYARTTIIAFEIDNERKMVSILGILSTSRDWPRLLSS